jgi:hypothetical protein
VYSTIKEEGYTADEDVDWDSQETSNKRNWRILHPIIRRRDYFYDFFFLFCLLHSFFTNGFYKVRWSHAMGRSYIGEPLAYTIGFLISTVRELLAIKELYNIRPGAGYTHRFLNRSTQSANTSIAQKVEITGHGFAVLYSGPWFDFHHSRAEYINSMFIEIVQLPSELPSNRVNTTPDFLMFQYLYKLL